MTLAFDRLRKEYGQVVAIDDVTASFAPGLIHGVIGPNGAGKSTLINMTAGSYTVSSGSIVLDGKRLDKLKKYQIANSGVARTYQNIRLFDQMTALENLEVCFYPTDVGGTWKEVLWPPYASSRRDHRREKCMEILRFFDLQGHADAEAGSLPYGRQRMLEIARALVCNPRVLLLDEPAAGLNHHETAELTARLAAQRSPDRITIIVEHDMDLVMALCDNMDLVTPREQERLYKAQAAELAGHSDTTFSGPLGDPDRDPYSSHDTVGAVALDLHGNVAAGTSTGGTLNKAPGRVGDSSLIGCGCYADNLSAAVSLTGWGEPIMKLVLGKWAVDRVAAGASPDEAAHAAIDYLFERLGGHGGIILLAPDGRVGLAHNTPRMAWGMQTPAGPQLGVTRN